MSDKTSIVAVDLGASHGRVIKGIYDGNVLETETIYDFENYPVQKDGSIYWDHIAIANNVMEPFFVFFARVKICFVNDKSSSIALSETASSSTTTTSSPFSIKRFALSIAKPTILFENSVSLTKSLTNISVWVRDFKNSLFFSVKVVLI